MMAGELFEYDHYRDPLRFAKSFFNSLPDSSFLTTIDYLLNRTSYGDEYHGCTFPEHLDHDERPFVGVKFWRMDEEIIIDEEIYLSLLKEACERFLNRIPNREAEVRNLLTRIEKSKIQLLKAKSGERMP